MCIEFRSYYRCNGRYHVKILEQPPEYYYEREQTQWQKNSPSSYSWYGTITSIGDSDEAISYAKQAAESAILLLKGRRIRVDFVSSGSYKQHSGESITIGFFKDAHDIVSSRYFDCDVKFELKHSYFNRQHEALNILPKYVINRLLPSKNMYSYNHRCMNLRGRNCSLDLDNSGQMEALTAILNQGMSPIIIAGPFGTGKTRVLAEQHMNYSCKIKTELY